MAVAAALCLVRRRSGSEPSGRLNLSAEGVHEEMVGKNGLGSVYIGCGWTSQRSKRRCDASSI